jgi:hypothetical protein
MPCKGDFLGCDINLCLGDVGTGLLPCSVCVCFFALSKFDLCMVIKHVLMSGFDVVI